MFRHTSRLQFESKPDPVYAPCLTKEHIRELQILPDLEKHEYLNFNPGFSRISRPFLAETQECSSDRTRPHPAIPECTWGGGQDRRRAAVAPQPSGHCTTKVEGVTDAILGTRRWVPWPGIVGGRCRAASGLSSRRAIEALSGHVHFRTSGKWPTSAEVTAAEECPGLRVLHAGTGSACRELEASTRPRWSARKREGNGS
jgi:hypothetical protein